MKERILNTLSELRAHALNRNLCISIYYQEERSNLMRFANSAISLNTNEHIIRFDITAYEGRKRASYGLVTNLDKLEEIKEGIDIAGEMVQHAQPLDYQPTIPEFTESFHDETGFDPALAQMGNEEKLSFFNAAVKGLETPEVRLSGVFSCGENCIAQISTGSEHTQFFHVSDAQVTIVLAHSDLKWEVQSEQSAHTRALLDPKPLHFELEFLLERYKSGTPVQLPLGEYDIVFGSAATADLLTIMNWIGFSGGAMKRGFSFLSEEKIGTKVFSTKVNIVDDPRLPETFPFRRDYLGIIRNPFPFIKDGIFQGFAWSQDDADEYSAKPTGHTVSHRSTSLQGGESPVESLIDLVTQPRARDLLYIPFLHYMNIVNPSRGIITASSRFGALLLGKDGSVKIPYNVRLTQSLLDIFGDNLDWLSKKRAAYNTSASYGARNPTAVVLPLFMKVKGLEISHSNSSY